MSLAALLPGVADRLTENNGKISLTALECDVMPDGQPPEKCGQVFVAVHPSQWNQTNDAGTALDETFGFQVTVSVRSRKVSGDAWGRATMCDPRKGTGQGGLYAVAEGVRAALHCDYTAIAKANSLIDIAADGQGTTANGFDPECIFFTGGDGRPAKRRADWWGSTTESLSEKGSPYAGLSLSLNFTVRRVQDIASQT
jgi:hypothetical protein